MGGSARPGPHVWPGPEAGRRALFLLALAMLLAIATWFMTRLLHAPEARLIAGGRG